MPFTKKFELKLYVPEHWEVAADMVERWANGLKNAAETANVRRQAKIPDDGTFINVMASRATQEYRAYLNPAFKSKSDRTAENIQDTHSKNIVTAFDRWNDKINKAYATVDGVVAKQFKSQVDNAQDKWALQVGSKVLRFTGDKIRGRSVAPIAAYYLVGDERAVGWIRPSDLADGAPYDIARDGERVALKAAFQQRLVQGGQMIVNSEYRASVLTSQNTINTALLNGFRDTTKADAFVLTPAADKCFCVWAMDGTLLYLHIQVGLTTP
ncbi:MAG: hypothetical protein HY762_05660 [Planctomycetes bacterium]|nr:hypothetical protein [Planctomycetota bacterium]